MSAVCPHCGSSTESPLVCGACGTLSPAPDAGLDPFAAFGLERDWKVDAGALRKALLRLQRAIHPDFFAGAAPEVRELAERNTAELNAAHEILADDFRRADWLVQALGGPDENAERQMPQAFLMEVMEWNETLEEARAAEPDSPERAAAHELGTTLRAERDALFDRLASLLTPLPTALPEGAESAPLVEARRQLNAVRYVDRALRQIEELRLAPR